MSKLILPYIITKDFQKCVVHKLYLLKYYCNDCQFTLCDPLHQIHTIQKLYEVSSDINNIYDCLNLRISLIIKQIFYRTIYFIWLIHL